jgi:hypothetical protein
LYERGAKRLIKNGANIFPWAGGGELEVQLKKFSKNERMEKKLLPNGRTTSIFSTETREKKR